MRVCSGPLENGDPAARPVALEGRQEMLNVSISKVAEIFRMKNVALRIKL